jgi:4-carboxymuconolactone decarboxylase
MSSRTSAVVIATGILQWVAMSAGLAQAPTSPVETVPPKRLDLPADVDPQSRSRLPLVKRDDLDEAGKKAYDAVVDPKSRLRAELIGPAGIWLHVPELSPHIREINWYLRNKINLDPALTELVVLTTVRESDGETEWAAHEPAALKAGLSQQAIDIVKFRRPLQDLSPKEIAIIKVGRELLGDKHLSAQTYAEALNLFGQKSLVEIVLLMANYSQTSIILHAFDQQLRPNLSPLLPVAKKRD